jgi:hypothetical protein
MTALALVLVLKLPNARGIVFNSDGTEMLISSVNTDKIYEYSLSTGFDVSTASYTSISLSVSQDTILGEWLLTLIVSKLFLPNYADSTVYEYTLPLALTLGTGSFASADVGKTIEANDGVFVLTATSGSLCRNHSTYIIRSSRIRLLGDVRRCL